MMRFADGMGWKSLRRRSAFVVFEVGSMLGALEVRFMSIIGRTPLLESGRAKGGIQGHSPGNTLAVHFLQEDMF